MGRQIDNEAPRSLPMECTRKVTPLPTAIDCFPEGECHSWGGRSRTFDASHHVTQVLTPFPYSVGDEPSDIEASRQSLLVQLSRVESVKEGMK